MEIFKRNKKRHRICYALLALSLSLPSIAFASENSIIKKNTDLNIKQVEEKTKETTALLNNLLSKITKNEEEKKEKEKEFEKLKKNGVVYYSQRDDRWKDNQYGWGSEGTIENNGCGPTSMAMAVSTLLKKEVKPDVMAEFAYKEGHMMPNNGGSFWTLFADAAKEYGLKSEETLNPDKAIEAVKNGKVVIISEDSSLGNYWTINGHFIVLAGVDDFGYLVNDPYSEEKTDTHHTYDEVFVPMKKMWIISEK